ncbi:hypothetical protein [Methylobacterium nigriterrae]|uniref:hypothetical protein n=1 Tax=Methylobacterium nigriterrae TaxID=3127512 RepID=UPI003013952B
MKRSMRFGQKIPTPSILQIKHELKLMAATDALMDSINSKTFTPINLATVIVSLKSCHDISEENAMRIIHKFGYDNGLLERPRQSYQGIHTKAVIASN